MILAVTGPLEDGNAWKFAEASGSNMWEKYENLKFDKIKPGKE